MTELSTFFIEKAKKELGEDETRKIQSIQLFREWLSKHPFIKCREIDDAEIVKYLRVRKFSIPRTCESFEKMISFMMKFPQINNLDEHDFARIFGFFDAGVLYPLKDRNADGSKTFIVHFSESEKQHISAMDFIRLFSFVAVAIENEPETQIAGLKYVYNLQGASIGYLNAIFGIQAQEIYKMDHHFPIRIKSIIVNGFSPLVMSLSNTVMTFFSKKARERIKFVKNINELHELVDASLLCEDFGGQQSRSECLAVFRPSVEKAYKNLKKVFANTEIDMDAYKRMKGEDTEAIGSFRTLEVD